MLENKTLLCISYNTCPIVYVNKNLSCLTYGRVLTKGRNYVGSQNLRIEMNWFEKYAFYFIITLKKVDVHFVKSKLRQ